MARMRTLLTIAVLLSVALAGCSKGTEQTEQEPDEASDKRVDVAPGVDVAENRAAVLGQVLSDAGLAIQDARVSLLGTPHFTDTDSKGRFRIIDVEPGAHTLQVQAQGFKTHEQGLELAAASAAHVNVTLLPSQGTLPTERPHVHDLWRGRAEVTLADIQYDLTKRPGFRGGTSPLYPAVYWPAMVLDPNTNTNSYPIPIPEQEDGSPSIVYPGTGRIEVTFDWTINEDSTKDELGLAYNGPNTGSTVEQPGPPGTTWTIPVNQTQVDGGHQQWTQWRFYIDFPNRVHDAPDWDPAVNLGDLHILIKIFRGEDPPLEPPHEDHWGDNTSLLLRSADVEASYGGYPTSSRETFELRLEGGDLNIVPPGTSKLLLRFTWRFENIVAPAVFGDEYDLMWRTAAQNPYTTTWDEYTIGEPVDEGEDWKTYEIDVAPEETDQFYYTHSDWSFSPFREGHENESSDYGAQNRDRVFTLEVVAVKGA